MKKILIVDDDKKSVAPLAIRLTNAGYQVLTSFDGIDGLKLAVRHRPDLIVMDIWMPGGTGILTAQRLKHFGLACRERVPGHALHIQQSKHFVAPHDGQQQF